MMYTHEVDYFDLDLLCGLIKVASLVSAQPADIDTCTKEYHFNGPYSLNCPPLLLKL